MDLRSECFAAWHATPYFLVTRTCNWSRMRNANCETTGTDLEITARVSLQP
jgi:hypothetical protein